MGKRGLGGRARTKPGALSHKASPTPKVSAAQEAPAEAQMALQGQVVSCHSLSSPACPPKSRARAAWGQGKPWLQEPACLQGLILSLPESGWKQVEPVVPKSSSPRP